MDNTSIQLQTVLYNNDVEMLLRSLHSISKAIDIYNIDKDKKIYVEVHYGDASLKQILSEETISSLQYQFNNMRIQYQYFGFNSGTARGHNILATDCSLDYILLMNPDVLFCPQFFNEILFPFKKYKKDVGIVEGRQTPIEHPKVYNLVTGETSWSSGACSLITTDLFHEVNGYDETFFMYCDDVDLSWRVRLLNRKVIYQPRAVVFHSKGLSREGGWIPTEAEIYYSTEAALFMARKWFDNKQLVALLKQFSLSGNKSLEKAYKKFIELQKSDKLPDPVSRSKEVAMFVNGNYALHRFKL